MKIAAEMIVPAVVRDDFGREVHTTTTFLRYELELAYEEPSNSVGSLGPAEASQRAPRLSQAR